MKLNSENSIQYWQDRFSGIDESEESHLSAIYHQGKPRWYNKFFLHQKKVTFKKLLKRMGSLQGKDVLDVGCGLGTFSLFVKRKNTAKVTGIDIARNVIKRNRESIPDIQFETMSANNISFKNNSFDFIYSLMTLQHIPHNEKDKAVYELCRVAKKRGYILIIESIDMADSSPHTFPISPYEWIRLFKSNGCELIKCLGHEYVPLIRLFKFGIELYKRSMKDNKVIKAETDSQEIEKTPKLSIRLKRVINELIKKFLIYISYFVEPICRFILPFNKALRSAFLFRKI